MRVSHVAAVLACAAAAGVPPANARAEAPRFTIDSNHFLPVTVGPSSDRHNCRVNYDLYVPAGADGGHQVPAILTTNGFGGSKDDQAGAAQFAATMGYEVLTYSGLGFGGTTGDTGNSNGASNTCPIELDRPAYDGEAASALIDLLARRPEVLKDGPSDPRVGLIGGSYGGGFQFATASIDPRVDAMVPLITWNDLGYSLAPNNTRPDLTFTDSPPGVLKLEWIDLFFGVGASQPIAGGDPTKVSADGTCPGFDSAVCSANLRGTARAFPDQQTIDLLRSASMVSFFRHVRVPTMLMQGEADTLFNIDEAVANYQDLLANGAPVKLVLQSWGHSDSTPKPDEFSVDHPALSQYEERLIVNWFDHYLKGRDVSTGPRVEYFRPWVYDATHSSAAAYATAPSWPVGSPQTLYLSGTQDLVTGAGAVRAGTSGFGTPGTGVGLSYSETSAVQNTPPFSGIPPYDPPGTFAAYSTTPLPSDTDVVGIPTATVSISAPTASTADPSSELVLFGKLYDVAPDGSLTLVQRLVSPLRVADLSQPVQMTLPGVVHRYPAGHSIRFVLAASDAAYIGSRTPQVITVTADPAHPSTVTLPVVPNGETAATTTGGTQGAVQAASTSGLANTSAAVPAPAPALLAGAAMLAAAAAGRRRRGARGR